MFFTALYKILPNSINISTTLTIGIVIYSILHYLIFNGIFNIPNYLYKYLYSFYAILIIDISVFVYLYKRDIDNAIDFIKSQNEKLTTILNNSKEQQEIKQEPVFIGSNTNQPVINNLQPAIITNKPIENRQEQPTMEINKPIEENQDSHSINIIKSTQPENNITIIEPDNKQAEEPDNKNNETEIEGESIKIN